MNSSKFYWVDFGSTLVVLTEGETGMNDSDYIVGNIPFAQSGFGLDDLAHLVDQQGWNDANAGQQTWQEAGAPSGI